MRGAGNEVTRPTRASCAFFRRGSACSPLDRADLLAGRRIHAVGPLARGDRAALPAAALAAPAVAATAATADLNHVDRLVLALIVDLVEGDLGSLGEGAEAVGLDGRLVDEEVIATRGGRDETEALLRVEPASDGKDGTAREYLGVCSESSAAAACSAEFAVPSLREGNDCS